MLRISKVVYLDARSILIVVSSMVALFMSLKYQATNINTLSLNFYRVPSHPIDSILLCNKVSNSSLRESDDILFSLLGLTHHNKAEKSLISTYQRERSSLTFIFISLLLSGEIHPCPGPPKFPCIDCAKGVHSNSKAVCCESCSNWIHIKCAGISRLQYDDMV